MDNSFGIYFRVFHSLVHPSNIHETLITNHPKTLQNSTPVSLANIYIHCFLSQQRNPPEWSKKLSQDSSSSLNWTVLAHPCTPLSNSNLTRSRNVSSPLTEYGLEQRISPFNQRTSRVLRLASLAVHVQESFHKSATNRYRSTNQPSPLPSRACLSCL